MFLESTEAQDKLLYSYATANSNTIAGPGILIVISKNTCVQPPSKAKTN